MWPWRGFLKERSYHSIGDCLKWMHLWLAQPLTKFPIRTVPNILLIEAWIWWNLQSTPILDILINVRFAKDPPLYPWKIKRPINRMWHAFAMYCSSIPTSLQYAWHARTQMARQCRNGHELTTCMYHGQESANELWNLTFFMICVKVKSVRGHVGRQGSRLKCCTYGEGPIISHKLLISRR